MADLALRDMRMPAMRWARTPPDTRRRSMIVKPVPPDAERVAYIVRNLRARDAEELFALRWDDDRDELVRHVMSYAGAMAVVWELDGLPVAAQGSAPLRPGVWANWCFGTELWPRVLLSMTRHARSFIMPKLVRAGFHRAEATSLLSHTDARGWIESLGGRLESVQRGAGRNGEDFATYVWTPEDVRRRIIV